MSKKSGLLIRFLNFKKTMSNSLSLKQSGWLQVNISTVFFLMSVVTAFAANGKNAVSVTAADYLSNASYYYIEGRLPTAEIECEEGLSKYPNDEKLQMLLERIREAKEEQKKQNEQNNGQNNEQNQNGSDNSENSDAGNSSSSGNSSDSNGSENSDNGENNENGNDSQESGNSSSSENSDADSSNSNSSGGGDNSGSSSSSAGSESSDSPENGEAPENENNKENNNENPPNTENATAPEPQSGEMTPTEASQLLKDFDEQKGERKPWRPIRGRAYPEKDW